MYTKTSTLVVTIGIIIALQEPEGKVSDCYRHNTSHQTPTRSESFYMDMQTAFELSDRAILKASFRKNEFSFIMEMDKHLSLSDQCLYYCTKCIEQSTDNILGYNIDFDFKTSRTVGDFYVDRATKICRICKVFEIMNPGLFDNLQDKLKDGLRTKIAVCGSFGSIQTILFQDGITWAKIIALFAFTGALVVECILQGNCEYVVNILYSVKQFMENELVVWITKNHGWAGMLRHFESLDITSPNDETGFLQNIKRCLRENVVETTQRVLYSLQDAIVHYEMP